MNATKRKFNALIQGIGARSTPPAGVDDRPPPDSSPSLTHDIPTTAAPAPSNATSSSPVPMSSFTSELLAKRRRVGVLGATTGNKNGLGGADGKTSISNVVLRKVTPNGSTTVAQSSAQVSKTEPARYCPGDREQLIRRLGTFQELTEWTPKPDKVNEIEWAKRGWVCQGKERVRCTLCHKELVVKTNKREENGKEVPVIVGSEFELALVKKFAELIVEAHQDDCLWRKRGCDDTLLRLSMTNPQIALPSLRERYDELCSRPAFLPYIFNLRLPPSLSLETVKSHLPPNFFTEPAPSNASATSSPNDVALALALTGWQGLTNARIGAVPNSASCTTCLRRLGLWMFKSKEVDPETNKVLVPAPMDHLDPVREHRFFCPWRNAAAQRNSGSKAAVTENKAAWEVLALTVRNAAYLSGRVPKTPTSGASKGHGRSQSSIIPGSRAPRTPGEADDPPLLMLGPEFVNDEDDEDESAREADDKKRWARLRRVKSLFDTKNGRKLRRAASRPGTASSRPGTARPEGEEGGGGGETAAAAPAVMG